MSHSQPKETFLNDYQAPAFQVEAVMLDFDLFDSHVIVKSTLSIKKIKANVQSLQLNGASQELLSIVLDDEVLLADQYEQTNDLLIIHQVPDIFVLTTEVKITPQDNTSLMGLYRSSDNFCTQCEAEGFRKITYFLDRPDVMSRFTTTITADKKKYPYLLSNGNCIEQIDLDNGRHKVCWQDPSLKPCYLFALVAGDFDVLSEPFITSSNREVELKFYLEKGFADQGQYALDSLKRAMRWDEEQFGREYDLDIYMVVAVSDFNMGAMENKGLNVFNTKYVLAKDDTATDADYVAIEDVIGHEYFHNWTGNRITCRDWFQLTLKEGLTVFRDQTFSEDMTSAAVARIGEVNVMRNHQFPEDAGPIAHPIRPQSYIEINNFYTSTVYRKGAEVIRMIRSLISKEGFRSGMDLYFERHDGQAVTTDDFVAAMADSSGRDFTQFARWYNQAGTPQLDITAQYEATNKTYTLTVNQSCPPTPGQQHKQPFHMPLAIGLIDENCNDLSLQLKGEDQSSVIEGTRILELTERSQEFTFINIDSNPIPSLNRGFSAPVKVSFNYSLDELAWLVRYDGDAVARWDAAQQLSTRLIISCAIDIIEGVQPGCNILLADTMKALFIGADTDLNLLAHLLVLPSVNYLLLQSDKVDVSALHQAREAVKKYLATELHEVLLSHYNKYHDRSVYEFSVDAMGRRSWKNACLSYLVLSEKPGVMELAYDQLKNSNNMTDSMGALMALNQVDHPYRAHALKEFYQQWQHEPLVVNKWLTLQAQSTLPNTLEHVMSLTKHASYNVNNPNNVYALICAYGANMASLHFSGYEHAYQFLADQTLAIDAYNPQVAARVVSPLIRWREFDNKRGQLMQAQLTRIAAQANLSLDLYELVQKSL